MARPYGGQEQQTEDTGKKRAGGLRDRREDSFQGGANRGGMVREARRLFKRKAARSTAIASLPRIVSINPPPSPAVHRAARKTGQADDAQPTQRRTLAGTTGNTTLDGCAGSLRMVETLPLARACCGVVQIPCVWLLALMEMRRR